MQVKKRFQILKYDAVKVLHSYTSKFGKLSNGHRTGKSQFSFQSQEGQIGFGKGRGTRDQIANIRWVIEKAREFQKNLYFCFIDFAKAFDCVDHNKLENSERDGNTRPSHLPLEKSMQVKKQQLELDMKQQTGSKLGKEYIKAAYCHPAYLTYMQSAS